MANECCNGIAEKLDQIADKIVRLPLDHKPSGVLDVTANGTYDAPPEIKGYRQVNVAVPIPIFTTQEKTATENGDVVPDTGYDGLSKVVVEVPSDVNNEDVTFAANGEYNPAPPYSGFGKVTVNVPDVPAVTQPLDVTANGTYTPPAGVDGFGEVTVNVPDVPAVVEPLAVTANGTYTPPSGVDGFGEVTVDVPAPQMSLDVTRYFFLRVNTSTKTIIATGENSIFSQNIKTPITIPIDNINGKDALFLAEAFIFIDDYAQNTQPVLVNASTLLYVTFDIKYKDPSTPDGTLTYPIAVVGDYYINTPTANPAPTAFYRVLFAENASTVLGDILLDSTVESIIISNAQLSVIYTTTCTVGTNTGVIVNLINGV